MMLLSLSLDGDGDEEEEDDDDDDVDDDERWLISQNWTLRIETSHMSTFTN